MRLTGHFQTYPKGKEKTNEKKTTEDLQINTSTYSEACRQNLTLRGTPDSRNKGGSVTVFRTIRPSVPATCGRILLITVRVAAQEAGHKVS